MTHLLDLTGDDIAKLDDSEFRELVAKLCEAQLSRAGFPATAVTWGGDQRAPDGGLDVFVSLPEGSEISGFVPRVNTGFQVKHSDMPPSAIKAEMRPGGVLRSFILELVQQRGAYIIACAQGSTSASALRNRIDEMRAAVAAVPGAHELFLDFYDRGRVATAVREHPALVPWIRDKIGSPMVGWYAYGDWPGTPSADSVYLVDGQCRLRDGRNPQEVPLAIEVGIDRLRTLLSTPSGSVRLVGLSGTGKTRLVQALFDSRVGHHALPETHAVYCDFSQDPVPAPAQMIQQLKRKGIRAVVVVDNCPPAVHQTLTEHCLAPGGAVGLLTVEFDVRDDIPEQSEVFKLEPASDDVIESLLARDRPQVSVVDRRRVAQFSGGNARIALAIGSHIRPGDSISKLSNRELFGRLFNQGQNSNDSLLRAAEAASLVYSFNGDTNTGSQSELDVLAQLADMSVIEFHRQMNTLIERDLVQRRGVWRALLPQALADMLARAALAAIPVGRVMQCLMQTAQPRLITSFTRRLGSLHDSPVARQLVEGWLRPGGMLGDWDTARLADATRLQNVAPVVPEAALAAMERWATGPTSDEFLTPHFLHRNTYVQVLAAIAYEPATFARAAWTLALFASTEPENQRHNGARRELTQLCRITLSGTQATLADRLTLVRRLAQSSLPPLSELAVEAYDAMMHDGSFSDFRAHGFGSRSRDHGLQPASKLDVTAWFSEVLRVTTEVAVSQSSLAPRLRALIAKHFRTFWLAGLPDQLAAVCSDLTRQSPWLEGWIAAQKVLRRDGDSMSAAVRGQLDLLIQQIKPKNIGETARAYVFSKPWGSLDIVDDDWHIAVTGAEVRDAHVTAELRTEELGREMSLSPGAGFGSLLPELMSKQAHRAMSFGRGLASSTNDIWGLWKMLVSALEALPEQARNFSALLGCLQGAVDRDRNLTEELLDDAATHPLLRQWLPALQVQVSTDERGLVRLEKALCGDAIPAWSFGVLKFGGRSDAIPPARLAAILLALAKLPGGVPVTVEILSMRLSSDKREKKTHPECLLHCARSLLHLAEFGDIDSMFDYCLSELVNACLIQPEAAADVTALCIKFFPPGPGYSLNWLAFDQLLTALFLTRPFECLDALFGEGVGTRTEHIMMMRPFRKGVFNVLPQATILEWAQRDAKCRFPVVALGLRPLKAEAEASPPEWSDTALAVLAAAPDRLAVLEAFASQFVPNSWSGSRAAVIENHRALLTRFIQGSDERESVWARDEDSRLLKIAEYERARERQQHQGFE